MREKVDIERLTKAIEDLAEAMRNRPPWYAPYFPYMPQPWETAQPWQPIQPTIIWTTTGGSADQNATVTITAPSYDGPNYVR
jgi:hypothetical protein